MEHHHPLALEAARQLEGQTPREGFVHCSGANSLPLRVHETRTAMVLDLMERLACLCEASGFRFRPGRQRSREPAAQALVIGREELFLSFTERRRRRLYRPTRPEQAKIDRGHSLYLPKYAYHPSGELTLTAEGDFGIRLEVVVSGKVGIDTDACLQTIPARLSALAEQIADNRREREAADERQRQREEKRKNLREAIEAEGDAVENLRNHASAWREAQNLREYIAVAGAANGAEWIEWASRQADRLDPLTPSPESILDSPEWKYVDDPYGEREERLAYLGLTDED